ncbi:BZ3500_MvSof-1268-A1-R1_C045g00138 [Microbotryum saponariae]|uniref:BZ3500_MvSof-1268-A1-R1_C045g00138 protein n=1 Tax=Microbotryum saponariae TaxID=289078 RepID=A0A2X0LB24_9BASI|nr:BZ3500_MvSof-1268-A1-R1_C045g00138 [Microbotryum saponariae]
MDRQPYCSHHGITRQLTIPYTPEQNGRAERTNRTIIEGTIALLQHSGLPMTLWREALRTANLRAFGCRAWHTTPQHKRAKLDPKAKPFIFVGIENKTKAWTLYDPETISFFQSCDVRFDENIFPARDAPTGLLNFILLQAFEHFNIGPPFVRHRQLAITTLMFHRPSRASPMHDTRSSQPLTCRPGLPRSPTLDHASFRARRATGSGSVELNTTSGRVAVADILHVPSLPCNLLSVRHLDRLGFTVSFSSNVATIRNAAGTAVATAWAIANDLYTLDLAAAPCTPHALLASPSQVSLLTLHNRLAHLPVLLLKRIVQKGMVTGVAWDYSDEECRTFNCNACLASKVHALPFARSKLIALQRLGLIHVDLAQMPHVSFGGHRYMLVIVDDHTRKHWCILLARKSDTFPRLRDWILEVERATGDSVKTIRSDNGGEFTLRSFVDFCCSKGIRRELTIPYTPQQNGRVERPNRTIKEGILALAYSAGVDSRLWGEAAMYFVRCKNMTPHAGVSGEIPDARWYGYAPDVSSLRTFGCRAWHCLPSASCSALDPKAMPLIFVGLDDHSKAYRLFNPATRKVLLSRNILFHESEFPTSTQIPASFSPANPLPDVVALRPDQADLPQPLLALTPAPDASDQGSPALARNVPDQELPTPFASDQGSPDSALSTPCPSPLLQPSSYDFSALCLAPEFSDDVDDALHSPAPVCYLADAAAALLDTSSVDPAELVAPARDPPHWRAAMASPQADKWRLAARDEFDSLFVISPLSRPSTNHLSPTTPKSLALASSFAPNADQFGKIKSYKGRLVARGDSLRSGIDFDETFAPVAKLTSIRALLTLSAARGYHVHQADIDKVYLHGKLDKLCTCAGRIWNDEIDSTLLGLGYVTTESDHCVYIKTVGDVHHYIALYIRRSSDGSITLSQEQYLKDILTRFGMSNAHPVATPMKSDLHLEIEINPAPFADRTRCLQAIGSLMYASTGTRPDLAYAVGYLARFSQSPSEAAWLTIGYAFLYAGGAISWSSRLQSRVQTPLATPNTWLSRMPARKPFSCVNCLVSWVSPLLPPTLVLGDNQGANALTKNPVFHARTRHIRLCEHFVRDMVALGDIAVQYINTADIFTKALARDLFARHRGRLGICSP